MTHLETKAQQRLQANYQKLGKDKEGLSPGAIRESMFLLGFKLLASRTEVSACYHGDFRVTAVCTMGGPKATEKGRTAASILKSTRSDGSGWRSSKSIYQVAH
ncbi:uncharacterized protein RBU33_028630 isoform 2-T3 [Hipposideros larvatus]